MRHILIMEMSRTTLSIEADLLPQAKKLARQDGRTLGAVVSDLMRKSLRPEPVPKMRNGVRLLPVYNPNAVVTLEHVNALRDEMS